jgi:hypothetical protein
MPPVRTKKKSATEQMASLSLQEGAPMEFKGFPILAPPPSRSRTAKKIEGCSEYLQPKYMNLMPYLYQASELVAKEIPEEERTEYVSEPKIHPIIQREFKTNATKARTASIKALITNRMKEKSFEPYKEQLEHFYNAVTIHSKQTFLDTAKNGFDWMRERLAPYGQSWVLMTENYVSNVSRAGILKVSQSIPFKSSEWVGKMFLSTLDKKSTSQCVVDSTNVRDVMTVPERSCYVLFDDGAYSGSQKGLILSSFIANVLPAREKTTLYLVIPYYTVYALNRFRMNVNSGIQILERNGIQAECAYEIQTENSCERYELIMKKDGTEHRLEIVIWTGGIQMEESDRIVTDGPGNLDTKQLFLIKMKGIDSLGATMTLFEHKVPDFLSLNAAFGNAFKDKKNMKEHYEYNPPYKVKPMKQAATSSSNVGGCGCRQSQGGAGKRLKGKAPRVKLVSKRLN